MFITKMFALYFISTQNPFSARFIAVIQKPGYLLIVGRFNLLHLFPHGILEQVHPLSLTTRNQKMRRGFLPLTKRNGNIAVKM